MREPYVIAIRSETSAICIEKVYDIIEIFFFIC